VADMLKGKIRGKNKIETLENVLTFLIVVFSFTLSFSIGLSSFYSRGIVVVIAIISSFLIFISTIFLVVVWLFRRV